MKIHHEMLKQLKAYYKPGSRVELERMNDPHTKLKAGDRGTVTLVDDIGTIHVNWDCGSTPWRGLRRRRLPVDRRR